MALDSPTIMFEDNTGCISLANNSMTTGKTKRVDVSCHFIRDMVKAKAIEITWCRTEDMIADASTDFTLPTGVHLKHVSRMMSGTYMGPNTA